MEKKRRGKWSWRKRLLVAALGGLALLVVGVYVVPWVAPEPEILLPKYEVPKPNGYDDFLKATQMIVWPIPDDSYLGFPKEPTPTKADWQALAQSNRPGIQRLRLGLTRDCLIPESPPRGLWRNQLRELARLLRLLGGYYETQNQPDKAAYLYLDCIRFGQKIPRGGGMIDCLTGMSIEMMGLAPLQACIGKHHRSKKCLRELESR